MDTNTQKVDLRLVLLAAAIGATSGDLISTLTEHLGCSTRAVKDALAVLRRSGYLAVRPDQRDRRRHLLHLTTRGMLVAVSPLAGTILRYARRLFTTCPGKAVKAFQSGLSEAERLDRLAWLEDALLHGRSG